MIPLTKPFLGSVENIHVKNAMSAGQLGAGENVHMFEDMWAKYNGYIYGVASSSGSSALYLALRALGVGPGDHVVVPDFTSVACAAAVKLAGATPVFVDIDHTLLMDLKLLEEAIQDFKPKAIMAVAIYGRQVQPQLFAIGRKYSVPVIEDLAEAHGVAPSGDIACYSFYGNKIMTTGEGGMCITNDPELALEMKNCRNFYFDKERSNTHAKFGFNFRMTNLQAAVGVGQVTSLASMLYARGRVMDWYAKYLPKRFRTSGRVVGWLYDICVEDIAPYAARLTAAGIEWRYFFKPLSAQPPFADSPTYVKGVALEMSQRGMLLPLYPELTEEDVKFICDTIKA